jgi:hypothetical protein
VYIYIYRERERDRGKQIFHNQIYIIIIAKQITLKNCLIK